MAQISLYINDSMAGKLSSAAKTHNCSVSKYVAAIITENLSKDESEEIRKKQVLKQLCGALDDQDFAIPSDIPRDDEITRRFDLI